MILVGAGYLGHALASYHGFEQRGFRIVGVFDNDPAKIGSQIGAVIVEGLDAMPAAIGQQRCQIAVIAVPATAAQRVAELLVAAGIKSLLCYAPIKLTVPSSIRVEYIDPVIHFQHMTFYLEKACVND